jgi:hypothetical protein
MTTGNCHLDTFSGAEPAAATSVPRRAASDGTPGEFFAQIEIRKTLTLRVLMNPAIWAKKRS